MSDPGKKSGCGCIGKGCLAMVILAVLFTGLGVRVYTKFAEKIHTHASGSPAELPVEKATQDEYEAILKRLDAFKNAAPGSQKSLELTARDLNILIAFSPEWEAVRGRMHVSIDKDQIGLTGSLPLDFMPLLENQYLNGAINFTLSMKDKALHLSVQGIQLKGNALSGDELKKLSDFSGAYLTNNMLPVLGPVLARTNTLEVKEGVITLTSD